MMFPFRPRHPISSQPEDISFLIHQEQKMRQNIITSIIIFHTTSYLEEIKFNKKILSFCKFQWPIEIMFLTETTPQ